VARIAHLDLCCRPGQECWYSNTGYLVLAILINRVSGLSYGEFLHRQIFSRLGLASTRHGDAAQALDRPTSFRWDGAGYESSPSDDPSSALGSGSLLSTAEDLARWPSSLRSGALLSGESLERMWTESRTDSGEPTGYGLGWAIRSTREDKQVFHLGRIDEFMAGVCLWLDTDLTVAWACNRFVPELGDLAERIAEALGPL
jgi:D-alanyl-D-alanine carboxypeptidase